MSDVPPYDPQRIESKWQKRWQDSDAFRADDRAATPDSSRYVLEMFPYPSGELRIDQARQYAIGDLIARYEWMRGRRVLHPMGWDAFGLPAENAALKEGIRPRIKTERNIDEMRAQLRKLGLAYDWSRELTTSDVSYYRWNQWLFLRLLESDLVYRRESDVCWCPRCETSIAHEQVVGEDECWRCNTKIELRHGQQWAFRITRYADELLSGLDELSGWPESVLTRQRNWIGRSDGLEIDLEVVGSHEKITAFTNQPELVVGATALVLGADHPAIESVTTPMEREEIENLLERISHPRRPHHHDDEKLAADTGAHAVNPITGEQIPIWVGNFVLTDYGSGALLAVPAHDERDREFAEKYAVRIRSVVSESGKMVDAGDFTGLDTTEAAERVMDRAVELGCGRRSTQYHLRDWGFSRQRYWGTPIPIVYCKTDGAVPVPDSELPIVLPPNAPVTARGEAPLSRFETFVETTCPKCGERAQRETATMDTFVDSSWYFLRFCDPDNEHAPFDRGKAQTWCPMDVYVGTTDHAFSHLLYFRFFTRALRDLGLIGFSEPVQRLLTPAHVTLDEENLDEAMTLMDIVESYGADTMRLFLLSSAPTDAELECNEDRLEGAFRFLSRMWPFVFAHRDAIRTAGPVQVEELAGPTLELWRLTHHTIHRVTEDLEADDFHTAVAVMRELINELRSIDESVLATDVGGRVLRFAVRSLICMLGPFTPHIAEEMWELIGEETPLWKANWPDYDPAGLEQETVTIAVQVNGKLRATIDVPAGSGEAEVKQAALADAAVSKHVKGRAIGRVIYKPGRVMNLVTE